MTYSKILRGLVVWLLFVVFIVIFLLDFEPLYKTIASVRKTLEIPTPSGLSNKEIYYSLLNSKEILQEGQRGLSP